MESFNHSVIFVMLVLFGQFFFMKSEICESTNFPNEDILVSIFLASCPFVNETPVLLIASQISIPLDISFPACVIVVGISFALGSFFNSLAIFEVHLTAQFTAINSQTSLAVGILPSVAI